MKHDIAKSTEMGGNLQRHRIELNLLCLDFDKYIGHGALKVIFVICEQLDWNLLRFFFVAEHNQRTHDQCGDGSSQIRTIMEHCRSTRMTAKFGVCVSHLGADHEHSKLNVLFGLGHINADGNAIRLSNHQQLLLPRE